MLTALRVVRLVDAAALAEECGGGAVAMAWLVLAIVSGGCLRLGAVAMAWLVLAIVSGGCLCLGAVAMAWLVLAIVSVGCLRL